MDRQKKHRLKQKDLVINVFSLFSEEYEQSGAKSIWDIEISDSQIIQYLQKRCDVDYKTRYWVWTQLKRYEDELSVPLFRKRRISNQEFSISLHFPFVNFFQKKHLYIPEKIKVANGIYDAIQNFANERLLNRPITILLGAGGLCYYLASVIAERSLHTNTQYVIYTHNLGALEQFTSPQTDYENISTCVPAGKVDPVTYALLGNSRKLYDTDDFDFIIQGTSFVHDTELFVESRDETPRKEQILHTSRGQKILALTKHEFCRKSIQNMKPYGTIHDYDRIIVPRRNSGSALEKEYEIIFEEYKELLEPEIMHWNYEIYKVRPANTQPSD